jgi:hypothetical protein
LDPTTVGSNLGSRLFQLCSERHARGGMQWLNLTTAIRLKYQSTPRVPQYERRKRTDGAEDIYPEIVFGRIISVAKPACGRQLRLALRARERHQSPSPVIFCKRKSLSTVCSHMYYWIDGNYPSRDVCPLEAVQDCKQATNHNPKCLQQHDARIQRLYRRLYAQMGFTCCSIPRL